LPLANTRCALYLGTGRGKGGESEVVALNRMGGTPMSRTQTGIRGQIAEMVDRIIERFEPERIILFGSHARGEAGADSDVDLLVVMPVKGSKREKAVEIGVALHDFPVPKDVLVVTPEEFQRRKEIVGTVERPADREGKVLYARSG
jgi:predicted nucleotidyltransferase